MPPRPTGWHHPAAVYAKQVTQGKLHDLCGPYEIAACQRHLDDLRRQGDEDFSYVFDETRADRILRWFSQCKQVRGVEAGVPIELQPWQIFDLSCVYGWVHRDTGARRFKKTYNKRGRGNFKSTEKSGQCLYALCADVIYPPHHPELAKWEAEPEVECAAVDREQAKRVFGDAKKIAENSPNIAKRLIIPRANPVTHRTRGGFMRALSRDTKNKDSGAPSYFVIDEYHAHQTSEIYDLGFGGFGKRPQPLLDIITTAGDDANSKPCYREEEYAKRLLTDPSIHDESYFVMIRELPDGANPHDKSLWPMANPCLRYPNEYSHYLLDQIESEYTAAYNSNDPGKIRNFLTRRMCQWQTGAVNRYLDENCMRMAKAAQVPPAEFAALTNGLECWCGFDLGKRIDLSGAASVFLLLDGRVAIRMHAFMPEEGADRHEKTDKVPYRAWAQNGHCTLTPGAVTDNGYVDNWIHDGIRTHGWRVAEICYDGHNATDLAIRLDEEHGSEWCVEIAQTCSGQNLAVKGFRELLLQGKIVLEENPLAIWCLANAIEVVNNYGDIKLSKKHKDDTERIDPVAAAMNALARALIRKNNPTLSDRIENGTFEL